GARRGNHLVMMRGTFGNIRIKNKMVGREGSFTIKYPEGKEMFIYDAAMEYKKEGIPLVVIAGKNYGMGSSRDWAAKGTYLLGVRAVIAQSFERIHRQNLIGMGVLPLKFKEGESADDLKIKGDEILTIDIQNLSLGKPLIVKVQSEDNFFEFEAIPQFESEYELNIYKEGGIFSSILNNLLF
ncbi:MAG: aconitate hydratase, partial [Thermoanaerobaculia bacterium]